MSNLQESLNPNKEDIKEQLFGLVKLHLQTREQTILNAIQRVEGSLKNETKSSAGDKHETGRAMLQLEREKLGLQLNNVQLDLTLLGRISLHEATNSVKMGSVVFTSQLNYFLSVGIGELTIDGDKFYSISPNSPIGQQLVSRKVGDEIVFRNHKIKILKII